jgi:catechol 2,3-dioxygenase-like lactoylglutathione lyase family enzyme
LIDHAVCGLTVRTATAKIGEMKIRKIDHVGIVVDDLPAAKAFFLDLGLKLLGESEVQGGWVGRVIGLNDVRSTVVMFGLPDGETNLELSKFHTPAAENGVQHSLANTLGIRHIALVVEDIEAVVAKLKEKGAELIGEIVNYKDVYKLCYVRGPEGIILELAEEIG